MKVFNNSGRTYAASIQIPPHQYADLPKEEAEKLLKGWPHEIMLSPGGDGPIDQSEEVARLTAELALSKRQNENLQKVLTGEKPEPDVAAPAEHAEKTKAKPGPKPKDKAE